MPSSPEEQFLREFARAQEQGNVPEPPESADPPPDPPDAGGAQALGATGLGAGAEQEAAESGMQAIVEQLMVISHQLDHLPERIRSVLVEE